MAQEEEQPQQKPKLRRLKIIQFRNVEPCELYFGDSFNILLGLNGSGKTTLLNLIAAVVSDDLSIYKDENFELEYELSDQDAKIRVSIRHERTPPLAGKGMRRTLHTSVSNEPDIRIEVHFQTPSFDINTILHGNRVTINGEKPEDKVGIRSSLEFPRLFGVATLLQNDPPNALSQWFNARATPLLGRLSLAHRFDEALDYFRGLTAASDKAYLLPEYPYQLSLQVNSNGSVDFFGHIPIDLCNQLSATLSERRKQNPIPPELITLDSEQILFLKQAAELMDFKRAELQVRLQEKKMEANGEARYEYGDFRFMFERIDGSIIPHNYLSFGQKRLLAFLYYLSCHKEIAVADELVNGLHHQWIEACMVELQKRQSFLAGQNPLLLDFLEFSSPQDVLHSFVQCKRIVRDQREYLEFRNMSEYDAQRVFEAYSVGIQHVSEILRDKGLW